MKTKLFVTVFLITLLAACGPSTKVSKSWMDPSVTAATWKPFQKVLVLGMVKDESTRRIVEDKLAAQFSGHAIQSYKYLSATDTVDAEVEAKLIKDGFDGVVYMRLANVEQSTSYVPGTTYGGFYGYRGYGYGMYGSPGYYQEDKTYNIETNIYSLQPPKLLWSGTTASVNPGKLSSTIDEVIMAIRDEFHKKGLIKN